MPSPTPAQPIPRRLQPSSSGVLVDVVVLSGEVGLYQSIHDAIGERNPVWRARSAEESVDLLMTGRCGVLVVDMGTVSTQPTTLIQQIVAQFPDVVVVVAGRREDEALLAQLISDGLIYRFMHKPLSPRRAGMFLGASIRHHLERREGIASDSLLPSVARLPAQLDARKWMFVAAGLGLFVVLVALTLGGLGREQAPSATTVTASGPAQSPGAPAQSSDPVLARARAAYAGARYESPAGRNALDLYAAVLLARPGHPEARAGLDRTIARILERADAAVSGGRKEDAQRLVARVLAVDPDNRFATAFAKTLDAPPPEPRVEEPPVPTAAPSLPAPVVPDSASARIDTDLLRKVPVSRIDLPSAGPAPQPNLKSPVPVVAPDPLTPRIVNADALRPATVAGRTASARTLDTPGVPGDPRAREATPESDGAGTSQSTGAGAAPAETVRLDTSSLSTDRFQPVVVSQPVYPADALRRHVEGWVQVEFTITENGTVRDVQVIDSRPAGVFDAAVTSAVGTWRFKPRLANGQPVAQRSLVTLRFNVDG